jgi:hypothetical protein
MVLALFDLLTTTSLRRRRFGDRRSGLDGADDHRLPSFSSALIDFFSSAFWQRSSATPPPGTMPSSTAARVALQGVFDAGLLLFHLGLGRCADVDHGDAADQLGQTLLQLLAVVVGGGLSRSGADLLDAALDVFFLAGAVDDGGVVLVDVTAWPCRGRQEVTFSSLMPRSSVTACRR